MTKKVNKSAEVRKLLKTTSSPSEIAKILKDRGIHVTPGYVSSLKSKQNQSLQHPKRRRGRPAKATRNQEAGLELAFDLVLAVGVHRANQMVAMAERLVDKARSFS